MNKNKIIVKTSPWILDMKKEFEEFIKDDEKKYIILFEMITNANFEQAEILEHLMLETIYKINEKIKMQDCDIYSKSDLVDAKFILGFIKLCINNNRFEEQIYNEYYNGLGKIW